MTQLRVKLIARLSNSNQNGPRSVNTVKYVEVRRSLAQDLVILSGIAILPLSPHNPYG